ncbi:unnamed protein product [Vitrella brassicaformis CCMP3155]|uniref:Uncharacterized protein n=1 Tax=Vitrella brassicaformis (strain CCMP3155) TaxID=1169540 RepID=A0A0G4EG00_VITBC|nr:unnamed protein product [Vitrella brassicaformis CCMP3155]|eukprot:CEL94305.1 unnamed protein product [Vitrella brassicaformis CCMP3155]
MLKMEVTFAEFNKLDFAPFQVRVWGKQVRGDVVKFFVSGTQDAVLAVGEYVTKNTQDGDGDEGGADGDGGVAKQQKSNKKKKHNKKNRKKNHKTASVVDQEEGETPPADTITSNINNNDAFNDPKMRVSKILTFGAHEWPGFDISQEGK